MKMYTTTLERLRSHKACERGYNLIANHVGVDFTGDIPLETILDVNGLDDCIWSLRATETGAVLGTTFAILCAKRVYKEVSWVSWADKWLSGEDRSVAAARAAARAAAAAAAAYAAADAYAAAYAAADADAAVYAAADADAAHTSARALAAERNAQTEILRKLIRGE